MLTAFVPDFARACHFTFLEKTLNAYPHVSTKDVEMMKFRLAPRDMFSQKYNPDNEKYYTMYNGTVNMTSVLKMESFGSKGHFFQVDESLMSKTSVIVDHGGKTILPSEENDETILGIDQKTGVTL